MYQEIRCPNCHHLIIAEEIDLSLEKGYCPDCKESFSLKSVLDYQIRLKNEIHQPEHFDVLILPGNELDIKYNFKFVKGYPRLNKVIYRIIKGQILFQGCLIVFFLPFILVMFFHFLLNITFFIVYFPIAILLIWKLFIHKNEDDKTKVTIKDNLLQIVNPPFKILTKFKIDPLYKIHCSDIQQLYVSEQKEQLSIFRLELRMVDGSIISPFYPFIEVKDALYLEQMIELFLQIKDKRDPNEIRL